ncbi:MAG: phage tail assembly chaperone [Sphingomonadaceae bacterium]
MSETRRFSSQAVRLCSLASRLPGWSPDTFWSATPADLAMALGPPDHASAPSPPCRQEILQMMERDPDG